MPNGALRPLPTSVIQLQKCYLLSVQNTLWSVPISVIQLHLAKIVAYDYLSVLFLGTTRGAMYEHLRVVPPGKRLRVPSCTRPEILGSG